MNRISGDLQIIDYTTQRVVATLQEHHYFDDVRHWEIKNTVDMLDFSVLENSEFVPYLQQQNLILKEVREGVIAPYVITEIEKDSARNILTVYASGLWTLLAFDPYISPQKITGYTAQQWLSFATVRTDWEVGLVETTGSTRSHEIKSFISPLALLHDISVLFDNYELQYRVTVQSGKITHKYVDLVKQRGANTGKEVTLGKDLNGIVRKENSENVITALVPFVMGQDAEGNEKLITIESVNNGLQYIVDEEAYQRWNVNGKHRFGFYTPQTEDQDMTPARLLSLAKTELKKRVSTIVSYEVDAVDIHTVFGLDHEKIEEGDTIRIIDEGMTPTLYLEARCIAGDESRRDPRQNKYIFGNYREIVDSNEELRKLYQKMLAMINDKVPKDLMEAIENKVNDANSKADQAITESKGAKDLATATQQYMEKNMVDIIEQPSAPTTGLKDGKSIWVDNSNPEEKVQKLWKNGQWVRITPDLQPLKNAVADAQQDIANAETQLETVKQDITNTKTDLTNSKTQLQGEINTAKQNISDLQTNINNKVDKTWIDQQLSDKADKSGVYTKEYIDKNTVGKSVYETDKQGNVTRFTNLETKQTQTETALTNKAEKSEVISLGDNLNQVSQKVNTVEQTANGNTTKISSLEGTLNTATGDIGNLKTKTNTIQNTVDENSAKITSLESRKVGSDNLVKAGSDKMTILPKNIGDASDNYNFVTVPVNMQMDREYTISARVKFTKGTDTKITVYPYTNGTQTHVTIGEGGLISHTFKKTNTSTVSILLYAGQAGSTRDKGVEFTEIMVTEGNTVVAYAPPSPTLSEYTQKTNEITQTVDTITTNLTSVTQKANQLETKTNTIENTVNGQAQTITSITSRTGTLETKTNELRNDVDGNTSTITQVTQSLAGGNENYIVDSSANNVYPVFYDDTSKNANNATMAFETDSLRLTCNNYTDAFYQIGATALTNMHGFKAGDEFTLSLDLKSEITGVQTVIYQGLNGTTWSETEAKTHNNTNWTRITHTFKLASTTKGWFIRVRFPRNSSANTKRIWIKNVKLEQGTIATPWSMNNAEILKVQNSIKQTTDSNTLAITGVTNRTGTLESKTNTIEQTLTTTTSQIDTLTTTQGQHGTLISQQGTAINQLNNEIGLRVKTTEMEDYVGKVGSNNMIMNSAFEDRVINTTSGTVTSRTPSLTKWILQGTGANKTVVAETSRSHEGYNSVKISSSGFDASQFVGIAQTFPVTANSGDYVYSAWFYVADKSLLQTEGGVIKLQFFNGSTGSTSVQTEILPKLVNNTWVRIDVKITAPATAVTSLRADIWVRRNGVIWVSQPLLQQGSVPSTFLENPKDYTNYEQLIGEVAKKVATSDYNSKILTIETSISQQSSRIDLKAEATEVYNKVESDGRFGSKSVVDSHTSQLSVMTTEINLRVKNNEIASTINQTAQSVLIQASKIYLDGFIEAKHLKANKLVGVTIETEPQVFAGAKLSLNRQNLTIVHNNISRGYLGFVDRTDANYQPMIQIGGAYVKDSSSSVAGSMIMSVIEDYSGSASLGVIGMAKSMSGNDIAYYNSLTFNPIDKTLKIMSEGDSEYKVTDGDLTIKAYSSRSIYGFVNIESSKALTLMSNNGRINFNKTYGSNYASLDFSSSYDTDFNLGHLRFRVSNHPDYSGLGFQVMNGTGFANMKLNILRATGNMSSEGTIYAVAFQPTSSRKIKTNFEDLPFSALQKVNSVNIKQYNFIKDVEAYEAGLSDKVETYYGMIAEDVDQVFASPERDSVNLYNISSISLQAIQEVDWKVNNMQFDIGMLKQQLDTERLEKVELQDRLAKLEALVETLISNKE
ncbi:phage tail spike protein [Bacillus paranthracis]|uniref:phage tail spike protein n=1 Tax=Bacillus paranthracis TaxID=2026186 RepID=UPI003D65B594